MSHDDHFYVKLDGKKTKVKIPSQKFESVATQGNLDVYGRSLNIKVESFIDRMCQRVSAVQFIQKFYRGYRVRRQVQNKKHRLKKALNSKRRGCKMLVEIFEQVRERVQRMHPCRKAFGVLLAPYWTQRNSEHINKIIRIQQAVKLWINSRVQD
jgi:hypothetical protein